MKARYSIGVFAVIFNSKKRVLLCHRRDMDLWNLPGGGVESMESPWEAVIREVKEETGLKVKVQKLTGVYAKNYKNDLVFTFLCKIVSGKLIENDEADNIEFYSLDNLTKNIIPHHIERITDVLKNTKSPFLKFQSEKNSLYNIVINKQ